MVRMKPRTLALFAVLGFAIRYRARGEDLDSWLALGATLTLFAELHYVLTPRVSSDSSTPRLMSGDCSWTLTMVPQVR